MLYPLVFFDQHGKQHRFKGQEVRGVGRCGDVIARRAKEIVKGALVLLAQRAAEFGERVLLAENHLSEGR